jgi:hypothetical protein
MFISSDGSKVTFKEIQSCLHIPPNKVSKSVLNTTVKPNQMIRSIPIRASKIDFMSVVSVLDQSKLEEDDFEHQQVVRPQRKIIDR